MKKNKKNDILKTAEALLDFYIIKDGTRQKIQVVKIYGCDIEITKAG